MWIYMPWVEQLNDGHVPETTEELYEYLVKVKTQDPNGNGVNDEIPMTGYLGGWSTDPTVWLINSFVQCNNPLSNTNPTRLSMLQSKMNTGMPFPISASCMRRGCWISRPLPRTPHSLQQP